MNGVGIQVPPDRIVEVGIALTARGFQRLSNFALGVGSKRDWIRRMTGYGTGGRGLGRRIWCSQSVIAQIVFATSAATSLVRYQSPEPGFGEKYWSLSALPSHSFQSGGGAFLTLIFGQIFAHSVTAISQALVRYQP